MTDMTILKAVVLGLVQGLTEFIPVSSSGHLVLLQKWLDVQNQGLTFDVALHIGTLLALLLYFHKDIRHLILGILGKNEQRRLGLMLLAATVPAVISGVLLKDAAETTFRSERLVATNLIIVAFIMLLAEWYAKRVEKKTELYSISTMQAVIIGAAQAVAVVPGVSRSGSTITAGLFAGMDRVAATRFSFLLAIPITFGAILKVLLDGAALTQIQNESGYFAMGIINALFSGLFAIRFLLRYLSKRSLSVFAYYRIALGTFVLLLGIVR